MTKAGARSVSLLGENAVLALGDIVDLLPRGSQARKVSWLRAHGLVRDMDGVDVVIWGDVLAALRGDAPSVPALAAPKAKDPWDTLERAPVGRK